MKRDLYNEDHDAFRDVVRTFAERHVAGEIERWEAQRTIDRDAWLEAGRQGIIGLPAPAEHGGGGLDDYRFRSVVIEELARVGAGSLNASFALQDDLAIPYIASLGTEDQKSRWLPSMVAGERIGAVAMTEPGAGSDLRGIRTAGRREPGGWVVSGSKIFITNGIQADIVVVVVRTEPGGGSRGFSLLAIESGMKGFERGRKLDKLGLHAQDTAELFFEEVFVPDENVLGEIGGGLGYLFDHLPLERLSIAVQAVGSSAAVLEETIRFTSERHAFGKRIADFQNTRFQLAELSTELDVTTAYVDKAMLAYEKDELTAVEAAKAKWWATDVQGRLMDRCLQLFGGYGYMMEYPVARPFQDARVQRIYGGTNEIMKEIIGRDLVGGR